MDIRTIYFAFVDKGYANPKTNLIDPMLSLENVDVSSSTGMDIYRDISGAVYVYHDRFHGDFDFMPNC